MAFEIERRFIVQGEEWRTFAKEPQKFQQGYLSTNFEEWVIRIRIIDNKKAEITLKAKAEFMSNYEFNYPIPLKDALLIWKLTSQRLYKERYKLTYGPGEWCVDCFQGNNHPLVLAEVEMLSKEDFIKVPRWCCHEITDIKELSNAALASYPIQSWNIKERQNFNLN